MTQLCAECDEVLYPYFLIVTVTTVQEADQGRHRRQHFLRGYAGEICMKHFPSLDGYRGALPFEDIRIVVHREGRKPEEAMIVALQKGDSESGYADCRVPLSGNHRRVGELGYLILEDAKRAFPVLMKDVEDTTLSEIRRITSQPYQENKIKPEKNKEARRIK